MLPLCQRANRIARVVINDQPISFLNSGIPVMVLAACAILLPRLIAGVETWSQRMLAAGIGLSALGLLVLGALIGVTRNPARRGTKSKGAN